MTIKLFGLEIYISKALLFAIATLTVLATGFVGYSVSQKNNGIIIDTEETGTIEDREVMAAAVTGNTPVKSDAAGGTPQDEIKVYITGCVKTPGIVTLKKGQVIDDAVKAAGGASSNADLDNINLVYKLNDNIMLKIWSKNEKRPGQNISPAGKGIDIIHDSGGAVVNEDTGESGSKGRINLNTASLSELDTLPGIGEATAKDIINYREKNGGFKEIKDIMKVARIKESRFNSIKDYITVN